MPKYEVTLRLRDVVVEVEADDPSMAVDQAIDEYAQDPTQAIVGKAAVPVEETD